MDKIDYYKRKLKEDPSNSILLYKLAVTYLELNKIEEALTYFQKSIESDSNNVKAYLKLANLLFTVDKIDKAIEVCQLGIDYNSESSDLYYLLEQLYEIVGAYELATQTLEDLINIDPHYSKAYESLGRLALLQENIDESRIWLNKLLELQPDNVNAYIYIANIYRKQSELDEAASYLNKAIELDDKNLDAYNDLGLIYLEKGQYDKAKELFELVLAKDPEYTYALDNLGFIYRKLKQYDKAEEILKKSLSESLQSWTYNELALVYTEQGKYKESIDCSKKALAVDKQYSFAYDNLAANYRKLGYYAEAENVLMKSLELKPDDSWIYNQLGLLNFEMAKFSSAKTNFIKSIEIDPEHYWPRINLASCYIRNNEFEKAKEYFEYLKLNYSKFARTHLLQSKLYCSLEEYPIAIESGEDALKIDSTDPLLLVNLGIIYKELNDFDKAEFYYDKAINTPRIKDSSVYLEYVIFNLLKQEYDKALYYSIKAQEVNELNYNVYSLMAIIQNSSGIETKFMSYIKDLERKFGERKEIFISYASAFLEIGLPEEAEKYYKIALSITDNFDLMDYGLAQVYYQIGMYDKSLDCALNNTTSRENIELSSYSNALAAISYKHLDDIDNFNKYKNLALEQNSIIKNSIKSKLSMRENLKYTARKELFRDLYVTF